jgi:hypothetical protein
MPPKSKKTRAPQRRRQARRKMTNQPEKASASVALTLQSGEQVPNFFTIIKCIVKQNNTFRF